MNKKYFEVVKSGMSKAKPPESCTVVIFGATGDLTHRELVPALYALRCMNLMPESFAIIGYARRDWSDDKFRQEMHAAVKKESDCKEEQWQEFAGHLHFVVGNFNDEPSAGYADLRERIEQIRETEHIADNVLFHLAVPPEFYGDIIQRLGASSLAASKKGWRRVIIEKPFGRDRKSAVTLDREIHKVFHETQIFRVDHFLGKETVQNMLVFRFANPGFEPIWNRNYIDNVQITVAEELGIGTRANFYEKTGVLRDMIQNHVLQLLCMTAIEPPVTFDAASLRTETNKVLQSICSVNIEEDVVLGQYGPGSLDGQEVRGYRGENNVQEKSTTPTYAALKVTLDNWRWADVPFYLRTGKRMPRKLTEVNIEFKPTPHLMFPVNRKEGMNRNHLTFRLQPDEGIIYNFLAKQPGAELVLRPVNLNFGYNTAFGIEEPPSAYQWLLFDAMEGDQTLFPRADWIDNAWSIVDPIVERWEAKPWLKLPNYKSGTWGPAKADELLKRDGKKWNNY
ncbi:MAG: glucose-6-phosphate dehydrogenase [Calditrichia bacterium]